MRFGMLSLGVVAMASIALAQTPAYRAPRTADGKPNLNGIWQAMNTANWDLEPHAAGMGYYWQDGAIGAIPPGIGVVDGGTIPYLPAALAKKKENFAKRMELDPEGDSATFLNLLLPDQESAQRCVQQFQQAGLGGFNYWYTNMYHFINQWDHLKELRTASALPINLLGSPQQYATLQLPKSQQTIGRLIDRKSTRLNSSHT